MYEPIIIERYNADNNSWQEFFRTRAISVNKGTLSKGASYLQADTLQNQVAKTFKVRYGKKIAQIEGNCSQYRIKHVGKYYDLVDYDDFQEQHLEVRLLGVSVE